jgi:glycosyltransferase involved in cell wall biosynthesis
MNRIATIVKGYPRLSETFIAQEILGLERRVIPQLIVSLRHPTDGKEHDLHREIKADVLYLPEYLKDDPPRVRAGRAAAECLPGYARALAAFEADLKRDPTVNRRRRFGQAAVLARELPPDIDWLHTHFLHTPASVARYAALMRGIPWSFSAHAKDIWTTPEWELREKLAAAEWGVTCTRVGLDYLRSLAAAPGKVHLVYHGLDFSRFPAPRKRPKHDGAPTVVSVGRAVEKKGYSDLLRALTAVKDIGWRFEHVGGGPLSARLQAQAERLGISDRIVWHGGQSRDFVFALLRRSDLFVLPSRLTSSGDRDGLPNVLMEAQAFGVAVLSTETSGIPELVTHGKNGWLVPERDPRALAAALRQLLQDDRLRQKLGAAGAKSVRKEFSSEPGIDLVARLLRGREATRGQDGAKRNPGLSDRQDAPRIALRSIRATASTR